MRQNVLADDIQYFHLSDLETFGTEQKYCINKLFGLCYMQFIQFCLERIRILTIKSILLPV